MKNFLIITFLALSVLCFSGGTGFGEQMYQVTVQELNELQSIFSELGSINKTLSSDLKLSKEELASQSLKLDTLEIRLTELQSESKLAKEDLMKAQSSLAEVRKSYEEYKSEQRRKLKIKDRQKIVVGILATGLGITIGTALSK